MLIRIVKMSFHKTKIDHFLEIFHKNKFEIRNFKGCNHLELQQDTENPSQIFSYSYWDSEKDLNTYRNSEFFKSVWAETKVLFNTKPEAWSVTKIENVP